MSILKRYAKVPALLTAAGLIAALPNTASAQGGVNLVPWAGVYIPTRNDIGDLDNALSRDISVIGGARLTFWGTGRLGFEVTGGYAPARISDETINETGNTDLLAASGRLLFALSPVTNSVGFYIGAGPALLTRGRNPFSEDESSTDFGGTAGVGLRFALGESGRTALRLDIEDYFYNGDFGGGDDFQNDIVASLGLSIALGGRADSDEP
ncbi:MAG: outer membrane beta-barrel protein [Gemmatimonadales bacterium]|nr:outer membrane beta-barrel protein [Gemmatimonadales bacterium]MBA3556555.1 outer membrane beta-barrel protein [Gemmatimonadales bacterium]